MAKTKQVRWTCSQCGKGALGPMRPRMENVVRYCLVCSKREGVLVKRSAPSLEKRAAQSAEKAKARAKAKQAQLDAKWMHEGVDLRKVLNRAMRLSSAKGMKRRPEFTIAHSKTKVYTTGRASGGRIHLTVGHDTTINYVIGVLLHELAHEVCYYLGEDWNDSSTKFSKRCHDLHDEWNVISDIKVCDRVTGAYAGRSKRLDLSKATVPIRISQRDGVPPAIFTERVATTQLVNEENYVGKGLWQIISAMHAKGLTVAIPGAAATEISFRYAETVSEESSPERHRFAEIWEARKIVKRGRGTQAVVDFGPGEIGLLREAIEWGIADWDDEPAAKAAAIRLVGKIANTKGK